MATEVVFPMLGVTVEKGKIVEWLKKEGDTVEKGESLFIVEAEKVTTEVESPASGILAKILLEEDKEVPVLTVVAVITAPGEAIPDEYSIAEPVAQAVEGGGTVQAAPAPVKPQDPCRCGGGLKIVPAARKLAQDKGLDLELLPTGTGPEGVITYRDIEIADATVMGTATKVSTMARRHAGREGISLAGIAGTGVRGRVMKDDVVRAVEDKRRPALGKVMAMNQMRQVIARRMSESKYTAPHIYFFTDICMDPLLRLRAETNADFELRYGLRPSVNDFLIKAVALNILDFPIMNSSIRDDEIIIHPEINICLAVALPDGLIVPAIANADMAGLAEIALQRKDLVQRARTGGLSIDELERGTFTVSSLAQYDINQFTAIINPPQSGILSIGKTREELYLKDGEVRTRRLSSFGLSVDHRVIDGAVAADFLQSLKMKLEKPGFTFLSR